MIRHSRVVERAALREDAVGYRDLPDVVQPATEAAAQQHVGREAEHATHVPRELGDLLAVELRHALADAGGKRESLRQADRLGLLRREVIGGELGEQANPIAPEALGGVQRPVGPVDELIRGAPRIDEDAADRHGDLEQAVVVTHGSARHALPQGIGDLVQLCVSIERGREDDELLAAPARDGVERAKRASEPRGHLDQHRIARQVPEGVVHELEAIDVDQQQARRQPLAARPRELGIEHLGEVAAIEDPRQRVGTRGLLEKLLGPDLGRRVADDSLDDQPVAVAPRASTAADPARHAIEADQAAEHLAHLTSQVARGVLRIQRSIVGMHRGDPRPPPVPVLRHTAEEAIAPGTHEDRAAATVRQHLVDVQVVVDRLDDPPERICSLVGLPHELLELHDAPAARLQLADVLVHTDSYRRMRQFTQDLELVSNGACLGARHPRHV